MRKIVKHVLWVTLLAVSLTFVFAHPVWVSAQGKGSNSLTGTVGEPVTKSVLDSLNPLKQPGNNSQDLSTPGAIMSRFLTVFAFPAAGLILFVMLLWGGFEMLLGAADKKSIDAGKQRITAALIGFLLLFTAFWIAKILEIVFGITILNG